MSFPGSVNGKVAPFLKGHERSRSDLWSSSSLIDPLKQPPSFSASPPVSTPPPGHLH